MIRASKNKNRKFYLFIFLIILLTQIACGTFEVVVLTPQARNPTETNNDINSQITISPSKTESPTLTPPSSTTTTQTIQPGFSNIIYFSYEPGVSIAQRVFPLGTRQVFVAWEYRNMREGLKIRKVWYRNSQVWFIQDDQWDFKRYGSDGTIEDVTVYDFEKGLSEGTYWLRLYIDGIEQTSTQYRDRESFRILTEKPLDLVTSPDGSSQAFLKDPRTLIIQDQNGNQNLFSMKHEIASLAWFPDSKHIIMSIRDRTRQDLSASPSNARDELWIIESDSGLRVRISTPDENLHLPSVSPDGHFVVAISGTGQYEACKADLSLSVIELDENYNRISIQDLDRFAGFPFEKTKPFPINHPAIPLPGKWIDKNRLAITIKFPCTSGDKDGVYILDLHTWQVEKTP